MTNPPSTNPIDAVSWSDSVEYSIVSSIDEVANGVDLPIYMCIPAVSPETCPLTQGAEPDRVPRYVGGPAAPLAATIRPLAGTRIHNAFPHPHDMHVAPPPTVTPAAFGHVVMSKGNLPSVPCTRQRVWLEADSSQLSSIIGNVNEQERDFCDVTRGMMIIIIASLHIRIPPSLASKDERVASVEAAPSAGQTNGLRR